MFLPSSIRVILLSCGLGQVLRVELNMGTNVRKGLLDVVEAPVQYAHDLSSVSHLLATYPSDIFVLALIISVATALLIKGSLRLYCKSMNDLRPLGAYCPRKDPVPSIWSFFKAIQTV